MTVPPVDPLELVRLAAPPRFMHDAYESPRVAKMRVGLIAAAGWIEELEKDGNRRAGMHNAAEQEANRLRAVIENAPHEIYSDDTACPVAYGEENAVCTCWKADAL
jgi:hypothetical protein